MRYRSAKQKTLRITDVTFTALQRTVRPHVLWGCKACPELRLFLHQLWGNDFQLKAFPVRHLDTRIHS